MWSGRKKGGVWEGQIAVNVQKNTIQFAAALLHESETIYQAFVISDWGFE